MSFQWQNYLGKLAVFCWGGQNLQQCMELAERLKVPLYREFDGSRSETFLLGWRDNCLTLWDKEPLKKGGMVIDIQPRQGEQHSWPAPKDGALTQAIGRKTKTVLDATTGWGQDSLHLFRMGYRVHCIERSPIMLELLADAFLRLDSVAWVKNLALSPPKLIAGDAIDLLSQLTEVPECIYIDPMFPVKRKKSALPKKSMLVLRDLLGDDPDKEALFEASLLATGRRVVVKNPSYALPLGGKPSESFRSKLVRYDVYLRSKRA